ncbi:MAG TPA: hypothetical protein VJV74_06875, partial [Terriglobia bacterium]|nr:hypothetical protein [Terriglobia bacterium]
ARRGPPVVEAAEEGRQAADMRATAADPRVEVTPAVEAVAVADTVAVEAAGVVAAAITSQFPVATQLTTIPA